MAHFAELDENNVVLQVIVVHNNELIDSQMAMKTKLKVFSFVILYLVMQQLDSNFL